MGTITSDTHRESPIPSNTIASAGIQRIFIVI